jgi:RepB plasmid partitioning protein/Response regulator receiver domain
MTYSGPGLNTMARPVPKVLVTDDEVIIAETLVMILYKAGFDAQAAYSGEMAVELARDFQPDVLIADVIMPGMSGIETAILVVYPRKANDYLLLDGHLRLDILKAQGVNEVRCTFATDDEAYTYNRRVNHAPPVAEHFMILKALENGVSEKRLAEALSVDVANIQKKRNLLNGICPEAVELLRNKQVAIEVFAVLRKMKPVRQIEAAKYMIAGGTFSTLFAKSLLAGTRPEFLVQATRRPKVEATSVAAQEMLSRETEQLIKDLKAVEESYGTDVLTLTVCRGYLKRMLANPRIEKYLSRNYVDLFDALKSSLIES